MTVKDINKVDFIGVHDNFVSLVITDHLEWGENDDDHMYTIQEKVNSYMRFYESGELLEKFPNSKDKPVVIEVALKHEPNENGNWFFSKLEPVLKDSGIKLVINVM